MPPDGSVFAAGQRFDVRVELGGATPEPLRVLLDGQKIRLEDIDPGPDFLGRGLSIAAPGAHDNTEVFLKILRSVTGAHGMEPSMSCR